MFFLKKILVSYFSASGVTKNVATKIAESIQGDLFEIEPKEKYTNQDLDWTNKNSRSSIEMAVPSSRPEILHLVDNVSQYDTILIGFPVWWYTAPNIIRTFLEENDFTGKKIYLFVTSGGSSEKKCFQDLKEEYPNLSFEKAKRFTGDESLNDYLLWIF